MFAAWWGVDAFVRSAELPGGSGEVADPIDRPGGPGEAAEGTGREPETDSRPATPVRLQGSGGATGATRAAALEAAARRVRAGEATAPASADEPLPAGDLQPGTTGGPPGDDVIVGNTYSLAEGDEAWVEPGYAWIGTPQQQIEGLLGTRVENVPLGIRYEAPRHAVLVEGYWFELTEVSNGRYLRFLQEAAGIEFTTPVGKARTPVEIVTALVGPRAPDGWVVDVTARQLVEANQAAVYASAPGLVVRDPATRNVDPEATWEGLRDAPLPSGLRLRFYDRAPPAHWPDDRFAAGRVDHPVRGVSLEDATACALWAGRHVPSEVEWEYAARGTRGLDFPWGDRARRFEDLVNGGRAAKAGASPDTVPVRSYPAGASWVGALNMLGNVAEWTSSRLLPYPESGLAALEGAVYRGGSAFDEEPLVVRPAFRGWVPLDEGDVTPPAWNRPRPGVGIRLARYEEPVRSATIAMHTRYRATGLLPEDALETEVFAGAQGVLDRRAFGDRQDPTVRPGVKTVVVQPLRYVLVPATPADPRVPAAVTDERWLQALSESGFLAFGLLHTDLQLLDVYAVELRGRRGPRIRPSVCPPGTWLIGLQDGHLALADPAGSAVFFYLSRARAGRAAVGVHRLPLRRDGEPQLAASLTSPKQGPRIDVRLELPLGNPAQPELVVRVSFDVRVEFDVLQTIRDWEVGAIER